MEKGTSEAAKGPHYPLPRDSLQQACTKISDRLDPATFKSDRPGALLPWIVN